MTVVSENQISSVGTIREIKTEGKQRVFREEFQHET
jgi:hypothetical protein